MSDNAQEVLTESVITRRPLVRNFRRAASLPRIYRCGSTDGMANFSEASEESRRQFDNDEDSPEYILLHRAGLLLDLRSPSERDDARAKAWMDVAPGGKIVARDHSSSDDEERGLTEGSDTLSASNCDRTAIRIDVLSSKRLFEYATDRWLAPSRRSLLNTTSSLANENNLHEHPMDALNERGLPGLYEAIVKTSGAELCCALKLLTEYFEKSANDDDAAAVVHCVQGKDRTGLVVMLCQSIAGLCDEEIIFDYSLSNQNTFGKTSGSAAANKISGNPVRRGKLDWNVFSGAPREAMEATLEMMRADYGSISPGYLDAIGFHEQWRRRFLSSVVGMPVRGQLSSML